MSDVSSSAPVAAESQAAPVESTHQVAPVDPTPQVDPVAPPTKIDQNIAQKFAALSRKEKQVRQQEQQLKAARAEMESWKKQQAELSSRKSLKERVAEKGIAALEDEGLSYKELTEQYLLKGEPTPEDRQKEVLNSLKAEIEALKAERAAERAQSEEKLKELNAQREQKVRENYLTSLKTHLSNNNEKYELIVANDAHQMVYESMEEAYALLEQEGGPDFKMSQEEIDALRDAAAEEVEAQLFENAKKLAQAKKVKGLFGSPEPKSEPKQSSPTLSNTLSQQVPTSSEEHLSDDESKKRMAAMLKFNG